MIGFVCLCPAVADPHVVIVMVARAIELSYLRRRPLFRSDEMSKIVSRSFHEAELVLYISGSFNVSEVHTASIFRVV
jgi:hypothetical protein